MQRGKNVEQYVELAELQMGHVQITRRQLGLKHPIVRERTLRTQAVMLMWSSARLISRSPIISYLY